MGPEALKAVAAKPEDQSSVPRASRDTGKEPASGTKLGATHLPCQRRIITNTFYDKRDDDKEKDADG